MGDDVTGALNQLEPVTCRITANQLYQDCVLVPFHTFEWLYAARFSPYWLGEPTATATLLLGFWREASQKRETASDADPA